MKKILLLMILCVSILLSSENVKRPRILGVAHIAFYITDIQKARAFYKDYLGFEEPYSLKQKDGSERVIVFKINDYQYIELTTGEPTKNGRLNHIAFYTDDIKAMKDYLSAQGVNVPEKIDKGRAGNLSFNITDPDGHIIEIVQYEPDSWTSREKGNFMPDSRVGIKIEHIGIATADEDIARKFYCEILSFKQSSKPQVPEGSERIEFGTYHKSPTSEFLGSRNHICLIAHPNVETVISILKKRNPEIEIETHMRKGNDWHANVYDPDGTRIELVDDK